MTIAVIIVTLTVALFIAYRLNKASAADKVEILENSEPAPLVEKVEVKVEQPTKKMKKVEEKSTKKIVKKENKKRK